MERWVDPSKQSQTCHIHLSKENSRSTYNTIESMKEYEDPDYLYDHKTLHRKSQVVPSPPPPPPPPMALRGTLRPTHLAIHQQRERSTPWRSVGMAAMMGGILILMLVSIVVFLMMGNRAQYGHPSSSSASSSTQDSFTLEEPPARREESRYEPLEVSPNHLLTLLLTKRKVCLFEASTDSDTFSLNQFEEDHIESARLLFYSNLSHAGVPVHPLQFQRYTRSMGVDHSCHVIIYDRGQTIWATYAAWIFKLFGHPRVSLLAGGYSGWKAAQRNSPQYRTEKGKSAAVSRQGDFSSSWNDSVVITFDDVFVNTEMGTYDVVDAQTREDYEGINSGALYGHIRGAVNIPIDRVFNYATGRWFPSSELSQIFRASGLSPSRPVIVYCSTSVRSSLIWWSLSKQGYHAKVYFGGWPEWVIRAPDYLKVLATSPV